MKKLVIFFILIPLLGFTQQKTNFNEEGIRSKNEERVDNLVKKYKKILTNTGGSQGWRLQIKFTSKRENILSYQRRFTNLYPEIPAQITFDSPYYKLTVGNFRTKNEALKIKNKIRKSFPGTHPISIIVDTDLLKK